MADKVIIRGDSYETRRPLFRIALLDEANAPFDLTGCTVRTTFKTTIMAPDADPTDSSAAIKHQIVIDGTGAATTTQGLYLDGPAAGGKLVQRLSSAESLALPLNVPLISDVEVTDANGEKFTFLFEEKLSTRDGVTNRTA